jgi:hypothetical protein
MSSKERYPSLQIFEIKSNTNDFFDSNGVCRLEFERDLDSIPREDFMSYICQHTIYTEDKETNMVLKKKKYMYLKRWEALRASDMGNEVQVADDEPFPEWKDVSSDNDFISKGLIYRLKPIIEYRPYTEEEIIHIMKTSENGNITCCLKPNLDKLYSFQFIGWNDNKDLILRTNRGEHLTLEEAFEKYTNKNGSPFGALVEE